MIREIITPENNKHTLKIPDSLIGKKLEVLVFEVEDQFFEEPLGKPKKSLEDLFNKFKVLLSIVKSLIPLIVTKLPIMSRITVDTNILLYFLDISLINKRKVAAEVILKKLLGQNSR